MHSFCYLLTYSMERVILKKLTVFLLVKKFPAFNGTRSLICYVTILKIDRHCLSFEESAIAFQ